MPRRRKTGTLTAEQIAQIDWLHLDLCSPLWDGLPPRPPKDHKCPHDRTHPTGMELCRACGDFGVCAVCGDEYIKRDLGGLRCGPCVEVAQLQIRLSNALHAQEARKAHNIAQKVKV